jgi:hypothetical protein
MNRPTLPTRIAGSPRVAALLFAGSGFAVWAWYQGHLTWWWLPIAALTTKKTLQSIQRVRRYKAWLADWRAVSGVNEPPPAKKKRGRGFLRFSATIALLAVIGIPLALPSVEGRSSLGELVVAWLFAMVFLLAVMIWRIRRWITARRTIDAVSGKEDEAVVECTLGLPASSPSRAEAEANLPEYCARLIGHSRAVRTSSDSTS